MKRVPLQCTRRSKSPEKDEERSASQTDSLLFRSTVSSTLLWGILLLLTSASFATRLYKVELPSRVCWDEAHFGKYASFYVNRSFFFDVHPPLGKMLLGAVGYITGYDGSFSFEKPGTPYDDTEYKGMRTFCAILGSFLVPLAYGVTWELTHSICSASLSACLVLFETGILTLSRFILLDPMLLFFIMSATYCYVKVRAASSAGRMSLFWLAGCGTCLACALSVKFVGAFTILHIGTSTVQELFKILGMKSLSLRDVIQHVLSRVYFLVMLPVIVYLLLFSVHLIVLSKSGKGDTFYSSAFQSTLDGNPLYSASMPGFLAYGGNFTLKSSRINGGYLHSHGHYYPDDGAPKQQQVTTYGHKDYNNDWRVKKRYLEPSDGDEVEAVKTGDIVRLEHIRTRRNLHAHDYAAPLSRSHKRMSCCDLNCTGHANDEFQIEVVSGGGDGGQIVPIGTTLRLIHMKEHCVVESREERLPKSWGFEQGEVTCNPNHRKPSDHSLWNVEQVWDARVPSVKLRSHKPGFFARFFESHHVMLEGNDNLKPKEEEFSSRPWMWPVDYRGQLFSTRDLRILLLGNPVIFWTCLLAFACSSILFVFDAIREKRQCTLSAEERELNSKTYGVLGWLFCGWLFHYVPFWPMTRILYFHHYFPAALFGCMFTGVFIDFATQRLTDKILPVQVRHISCCSMCVLFIGCFCYSFYLFRPLAYGYESSSADDRIEATSPMCNLQWLNTWEF